MSRRSRPWVVLIKDRDSWWPRAYFDNKESAENYAISKSKGNNMTFRIEKNSPTNPSMKQFRSKSVHTTTGGDRITNLKGITVKR
jgi:hypothetical protein